MKLLVIRMSTLATLVVLGLIAIAQAQRSVEAPSSGALASEVSQAVNPDQSAVHTPLRGAGAAAEPDLHAGPTTNPLRAQSQSASAGAAKTSGAIEQQRYAQLASSDRSVDTTEPGMETSQAAVDPTQPVGSKQLDPQTARDPFPRASAAAGDPTPGASRQAGQLAEAAQTPADRPFGGLRLDEGETGSTAYPQLPPLVETAESDPSAAGPPATTPPEPAQSPSAPSSLPPLAGDGAQGTTGPVGAPADTREPARLELDPGERVSSLPHASRPLAHGTALHGVRPDLDAAGLSFQGTGTPGSERLEGPQSPQVTIQKLAPDEIQVGREATFRVKVINSGRAAAEGVQVCDEVPRGTRLAGTDPEASRDAQGNVVWDLGTLEPGEEASVEMRVMPEEEGEIGSVASVRFHADASARCVATRPELAVRTSAPSQVLIGEEATLSITVSNPGSGVAYDVVLEEHVPPGFRHEAGDVLENALGDLPPNESRRLDLILVAEKPGVFTNVLNAHAEANLQVEDQLPIEVIAPRLDVSMAGPKHRYLEREATYEISVSNPGTAPARNIELVAHLPPGLDFVSANNEGQYEAATRTVHWFLEELPVDEPGSVRLTTMPVEMGEQTLRYTCTGEPALSLEGEQPVVVEGIAAILFQVVDVEDPIELGGETVYEIRVVNQGSKAAGHVQLKATVPPGMQTVAAEGPVTYRIAGNLVIFDPLPRLAPKADTTYRVRVQGLQPGDLRLSVQLQTAEMDTPVTKEESTRVYSDR